MIEFIKPEVSNFTHYCLIRGGSINDLYIPENTSEFPGLCNPSIYNDNGSLKCILRSVNFIMHITKSNEISCNEGPFQYINRDIEDKQLKTRNFILDLDSNLNVTNYKLIDTIIDHKSQWEFEGEEDMRLFRWNDTLYGCGVVRDDNSTGVGRMRLSELDDNREVSQIKLDGEFGYCEKNWIPILDRPYQFIRTTYPETEIIEVNPKNGNCKSILKKSQKVAPRHDMMLRGSSQVLHIDNYYIALVHSCNFYRDYIDRKFARYYHQFVVWDTNWNIVKISRLFSFTDHLVEFSNGMCEYGDDIIISFAISDNSSYLLRLPKNTLKEFLDETDLGFNNDIYFDPVLNSNNSIDLNNKYWLDTNDIHSIRWKLENTSNLYQYQLYLDLYDNSNDITEKYNCIFLATRLLADYGQRDVREFLMWLKCIEIDSSRPEGYLALSMYYKYRNNNFCANIFSNLAWNHKNNLKIFYSREVFEEIYTENMIDVGRAEEVGSIYKSKRIL